MATTSRSESVDMSQFGTAFARSIGDSRWPQADPSPACETDHPAIHRFLRAVSARLNAADFQSQIDAPQYHPADRLVVKDRGEVIAHVLMSSRLLKFGGLELRATDVRQLATLPEYRDRGLAKRLLEDALHDMRINGSVVATTSTRLIDFYRQQGWVRCGEETTCSISPQDLLAHLEVSQSSGRTAWSTSPRSLMVRPWRQHEIDELADVYDAATAQAFGPWVRRASHWRWLMSRPCGYTQAFVVVDGAQSAATPIEFDQAGRIVGYCVVRGNRIIELVTRPDDVEALRRLLLAMCQDAVEMGRHVVEFTGPIDHPVFELVVAAGGRFQSSQRSGSRELMARVLDVEALVKQLRPLLWERVQAAGVASSQSIFIQAGGDALELAVQKRSVSVARVTASRGLATHSLELSNNQLGQLLLGYLHLPHEVESGSLRVSSAAGLRLASALFPKLPFWRPLLDDTLED